jgi:hypothetical protein
MQTKRAYYHSLSYTRIQMDNWLNSPKAKTIEPPLEAIQGSISSANSTTFTVDEKDYTGRECAVGCGKIWIDGAPVADIKGVPAIYVKL